MPRTKSSLSIKPLTIPAGRTIPLNVSGDTIYILESTAEFYMGVGDRESDLSPFNFGLGFRLPSGDGFGQLQMQNRSAVDVVLKYAVTNGGELLDNRLNVVRANPLYVQNVDAPTKFKPAEPQTIAAAGSLTFLGTINTGGLTRRKFFSVTNRDAALELLLRDSAGTEITAIPPKQTMGYSTDDTFQIYNPNGAIVAIRVAELFYTA